MRDMIEDADQPVNQKGLIKRRAVRIGVGRVVDKSLQQLASQGSYINSALQGALMQLIRDNGRAPRSPDLFDAKLEHATFTNGADQQFVRLLYRRTATTILKHTPALRFVCLRWSKRDWEQLNAALALCERLETLVVSYSESLETTELRGLVQALPDTIKYLDLVHCAHLAASLAWRAYHASRSSC